MRKELIIKSNIFCCLLFSTLTFSAENQVDPQPIVCSVPDNTQSPHNFISSIVTKIFTIQSINIYEINKAKKFISIDLSDSAKAIYSYLEKKDCEIDERTRTSGYKMLRILAVMNEVYPNKEWTSDTQLMDIFEHVKKIDPMDTELLRKRDWSSEF